MQLVLVLLAVMSSAVLVAIALPMPTSNFVVEWSPGEDNDDESGTRGPDRPIVLTDKAILGRHPCASDSKCQCLYDVQFRDLTVNCSSNNLTKMHQLITRFRLDIYLHLDRNDIEQIVDMTKNGYENVKSLSLAYNRIKTIPDNAISNKLQHLLLEGNQITRVDSMVIAKIQISKISWISLYENPIICDCDALPLVTFVQRKVKWNYIQLKLTTCADRNNTLLTHLQPSDLC